MRVCAEISLMKNVKESCFKTNSDICNVTENAMPLYIFFFSFFFVNEENELCLAVASVLSDASLSSSDVSGSS